MNKKEKLISKELKIEQNGFLDIAIKVFEIGSGEPRIAVLNGLHGLERTGAYLMPKIFSKIKLRGGTIAFIPFANPTSAARNTRLTPEDSQDLNRIFPGKKDGTLSFRLASVLFDYLKNFDLVIDVHTFPKMEMPVIGVFFSNIEAGRGKKLLDLIKVFAPDFIWKLDTTKGETAKAGSLIEALLKIGGLAFSVEVPDVEIIGEIQEGKFIKGVQNVVDVLSETKPLRPSEKIPVITREPSLASSTGFFVPRKAVSQRVKRGDAVGEIVKLDGFGSEIVRAAASGPVIFILKKTYVSLGDRVAIVGNIIE